MLNNIKKRHVLAIYAFFGYFVAYALRANLSVAIVDMSKTNLNTMERIEDDEDVDHDYHNDISFSNSTTTKLNLLHHVKAEQWSPVLQGYILSSFFYGYIVTQLPAGTNTFIRQKRSVIPSLIHCLVGRSFRIVQVRRKAVLWPRRRHMLRAQLDHAAGGQDRPGHAHRLAHCSGLVAGLRLSLHALLVVEVGAADRAQHAHHVRPVRLVHRLRGCSQLQRNYQLHAQLGVDLLLVRRHGHRVVCSLVPTRARDALRAHVDRPRGETNARIVPIMCTSNFKSLSFSIFSS